MRVNLFITLVFLLLAVVEAYADNREVPFTQADRDRIIRMEAILEQHDKRFEDINKRFEDINKRFDDMNARIDQIVKMMGWMIALFGGIVASTIGFALWDRRTMIRPFETKIKTLEDSVSATSSKLTTNQENTGKLIAVLRELAKTDNKIKELLKTHNLL